MIREEIPNMLQASPRPGYGSGWNTPVKLPAVESWIHAARATGVRSILVLLDEQHLGLYGSLPDGLLAVYRAAGFEVAHISVVEYANPPLNAEQLQRLEQHFARLPKPVLIHCSAGVVRTGAAVAHLREVLGQ